MTDQEKPTDQELAKNVKEDARIEAMLLANPFVPAEVKKRVRAVGRMVAAVMFGLAEIELEYRRERQAAASRWPRPAASTRGADAAPPEPSRNAPSNSAPVA